MIDIATGKARAAQVENVHFATLSLEEASLDDESLKSALLEQGEFDAVLAFNLLHLVADVPTAVGRAYALVRPGGLFISKTRCIGDNGALVRAVIPLLHALGQAPFVNRVTRDSLEEALHSAGFETVETGFYPEKTSSLFIVARKPNA